MTLRKLHLRSFRNHSAKSQEAIWSGHNTVSKHTLHKYNHDRKLVSYVINNHAGLYKALKDNHLH